MKLSKRPSGPLADRLSYTIDEVVEATSIRRSSLYAEVRAGRLRARKCGRRTVILREDLERFLASLPETQPQAVAS